MWFRDEIQEKTLPMLTSSLGVTDKRIDSINGMTCNDYIWSTLLPQLDRIH